MRGLLVHVDRTPCVLEDIVVPLALPVIATVVVVVSLAAVILQTRAASKLTATAATQVSKLIQELGRLVESIDALCARSQPSHERANELPASDAEPQPEKITSLAEVASPKHESRKPEGDVIRGVSEYLNQQLAPPNPEANRTQQLYALLKRLLDDRTPRLAALPLAQAPSSSTAIASPAAQPDAGEGDKAHRTAARVARVMIADLFLYNEKAKAEDVTEEDLRKIIDTEYRAARETFDARIAEEVRENRDYLELELEQVIRKRTGSAASTASATTAPADKVGSETESTQVADHDVAARVAEMMVADLLLDNWKLVENGVRDGNLAARLDTKRTEARKAFESRVAQPVWSDTHHFDIRLEKILWEAQDNLLDREIEEKLQSQLRDLGGDSASRS